MFNSALRVVLFAAMTVLLSPLMSPANAGTTDGTPDTTFSTNSGSGFNNDVFSVAVQSDGKVVVGGNFTTLKGATVNFVARLNADGTPDTAFNTNSEETLDDAVRSVAVQADGKIVVGGDFDNYIARLNADGTPDTAFNTRSDTAFDNPVTSVAVQTDGKIVVGGEFENYIARLSVDGTPDSAFATNTGTSFDNSVSSVAVQTDGKIIVGGRFNILNNLPTKRVARLNTNGTPDTAFTTNIGTGFSADVYSVAVQTDGKIIVGGRFATLNGATVNRIGRLNADGTPDIAFTIKTGNGFDGNVVSIAVQTDGKIVVGGNFTSLNDATVNYIAQLNADGTPDTAFTTNSGTGFDSTVYSVAVQTDGKIVSGGEFTTLNGARAKGVARLEGGVSGPATTPSTLIIRQALPLPASGTCIDITPEQNTFAAYGTGVSNGWSKGWEPWVNKTLDARGESIGGFACVRYLINTGGANWRATNTVG